MKLIDTTDERLYTTANKIDNVKSLSVKLLKEKLIKSLHQEDCISLSACQLGRSEAMFVMYSKNRLITCINPEILWESKDTISTKEHCASFPKLSIDLARPKKIIVRYTNTKGDSITETLEGIDARYFQHELDHLNGITFIHRQNGKV